MLYLLFFILGAMFGLLIFSLLSMIPEEHPRAVGESNQEVMDSKNSPELKIIHGAICNYPPKSRHLST